jgi:hypothetical protein
VGVQQIGQELGEGLQIGQVLEEVEAASEGGVVEWLVEQKNPNEVEVVADPMGLENYVLHPEFLHRWQHYPPTGRIQVNNSALHIWGQHHAAQDGRWTVECLQLQPGNISAKLRIFLYVTQFTPADR